MNKNKKEETVIVVHTSNMQIGCLIACGLLIAASIGILVGLLM